MLAWIAIAAGCDNRSDSLPPPSSGAEPAHGVSDSSVPKSGASKQTAPSRPEVGAQIVVPKLVAASKTVVDIQLLSHGSVGPTRTQIIPGKKYDYGVKLPDTVIDGWEDSQLFSGRVILGAIVKLTSSVETNVSLSRATVACLLNQTNVGPYFFQPISVSGAKLSASAEADLAQFNPLLEHFNGESTLRYPAVVGKNVNLTCSFTTNGTVTIGIAFETFGQTNNGLRIFDRTFTAGDLRSKRVN